ncbi:MAG: quinoprotein dehydrogenase-associated putative ABC transporter substrate-binding protein [Bacteroidota bacterium]
MSSRFPELQAPAPRPRAPLPLAARRARAVAAAVVAALLPAAAAAIVLLGAHDSSAGAPRRVLRVAADPNNYPFTDSLRRGFENRIADLLARDLGMEVRYVWRAQRRGFFRETLSSGDADLVLAAPAGFDKALTTGPYYRSSYVLVSRRDRKLRIRSLDDPALRGLRIGVPLVGGDGTNPPPALALARRGLAANVVGYTVYGDYREPSPPARILDAVARGDIDVAAVWGPLAGDYAKRSPVALDVRPIVPEREDAGIPFAFDISMAVRKGNAALRDSIDGVLRKESHAIARILDRYGVPRLDSPRPASATDASAAKERAP